jgi:NADPH-dependent 7-cyano-7-deazaguanine reductase QueF
MTENLPSARFFYFVHTDDRKTSCYNGCEIPKGQLKLKEYMGSFYGHNEFRHYCLRCAVKILDREMQSLAFMMATIGKHLNPDEILSESKTKHGGGIDAGVE